MGCSVHKRLKEHIADIIYERENKLVSAKHSKSSKQYVCIEDAKVIINVDH